MIWWQLQVVEKKTGEELHWVVKTMAGELFEIRHKFHE